MIPFKTLSEAGLQQLKTSAAVTDELLELSERLRKFEASERVTWSRLRDQLYVLEVPGVAIATNGKLHTEIPSLGWRHPMFEEILPGGRVRWIEKGEPTEFIAVAGKNDLARVIGEGTTTSQVIATGAAEKRCRQWLEDLMRASPHKSDRPKADYCAEAIATFEIGERAFNRCWANALASTNSTWGRAGRKGNRRT